MKKALFDETGLPIAFYDTAINGSIPSAAITLTQQQWREFVNNAGRRKWLAGEGGESGEVVEYIPPPPPIDLKAALADIRWQKEVGGTTINGLVVPTDDRAKTLLLGARVRASNGDPQALCNFKMEGGDWSSMSNADMLAVGEAVADFVQACFDAEMTVDAMIDAGTITTVQEAIDAFDNALNPPAPE